MTGLFMKCFYLLLGLLIVACSSNSKKETPKTLSASKGLPYEMLLIVDEAIWNSSSKDSLETVFKGDVPGLTQSEPQFRVMRIFPQDYATRYSTFRNIVEVRLKPELQVPELKVGYNVKAKPQIYLCLFAPDNSSLNTYLSSNGDEMVQLLVDSELKYEMMSLNKKYSKVVNDATRRLVGYDVRVPSDIERMKTGDKFIWASTDRLEKDLNFVCYVLPYVPDENVFMKKWVEKRDSVMKINIPGSTPEKWMTTTQEEGVPIVLHKVYDLPDNRKVMEMRGLWEMRKGAIGGPFVSLAFPDKKNNRILVVEGFVYSPDTEKRDLIRRMEAALRTFKSIK